MKIHFSLGQFSTFCIYIDLIIIYMRLFIYYIYQKIINLENKCYASKNFIFLYNVYTYFYYISNKTRKYFFLIKILIIIPINTLTFIINYLTNYNLITYYYFFMDTKFNARAWCTHRAPCIISLYITYIFL